MGTGGGGGRKHKSRLGPKKSSSIRKTKTKDKNKKKTPHSSKKIKQRSERNKKNGNETAAAVAKKSKKNDVVQWATASQQLSFFAKQYQSANRVQLSSLELDSVRETRFIELCPGTEHNTTGNLGEHIKIAFGSSWKEVLCGKHLQEGKVEPGSPALLVISSSALRSLDLIRELRSLTKECHAAKLFSKHMKVEEQVSILKNRVNIASGTPSRIKKLIDMEALGLSRISVIVFDMHTDVKGYSLFTLPQVRDEFWDLYRSYFHQPLIEGNIRLCLYGPVPIDSGGKEERS